MKDYQTTLNRLLIILNRLYLGELLSVSELADEFGVSNRTIQRYFNNYLKDFPLKKIGKKWTIDNFQIELNSDTKIAFEALEKIAKKAGFYSQIEIYLKKLKLSSKNVFHTTLKIENIGDKFEFIVLLEEAINNNKYVEFFYKQKKYKVKPLKIANFDGYWYLLSIEDKDYKFFYIKNIYNLKLLEDSFIKGDENIENAINAWYTPNNIIEVEFLADEYVSKYLEKIPLNSTQIKINTYEDKTTLFQVKITHFMEIEKFIKSWIPRVKVLKPIELHNKIIQDLKKYINL